MLVSSEGGGELPAQLEINSYSFESLEKALEPIEEEQLPGTLMEINVVRERKHIKLEFKAIF